MTKASLPLIETARFTSQPRRVLPVVVPDYEQPAALMVPHFNDQTVRPLLEQIAATASRRVGVILLTPDPPTAQEFIARQKSPERFSVVGARYDSPWIRDRGPIAVREGRLIRWVLPRLPNGERRPLDDALFARISARPATPAALILAQGNLVAGPQGLAISSTRILHENGFSDARELAPFAPTFGIRQWLVFDPFPDEQTQHADVHVRFLRADLMAIAWHPSEPEIQRRARAIERAVRRIAPKVRSLRIPLTREGNRYASLVNWIQLKRDLLMPVYEMTSESCLAEASERLNREGFRVHPIRSPTLDLGGSLHCLTSSIFV
jgi:agmatine/peptidylarginine deiminase